MKKYTQIHVFQTAFLLFLACFLLWTSCKKEEDSSPPSIERIRLTIKDSTVTAAGYGNTVVVMGAHLGTTQQVLFNDYPASVNPSFVQDDKVLVQVPRDAPYRNTTNKIKIVTKYGEATTNFSILQPAPTIKSFAPASGNIGDTVIIRGKDLDNIKEARIGAGIVPVLAGGNDSIIRVKVTPDSQQGLITVTTVGGVGISPSSFGVSLIIYDDKMTSGWDAYEWDADRNMSSTEQVKKGKSIKMTFSAAYGGFGAGTSDVIDVKKYTALKISIYAVTTDPEVKFKIGIKGANGTTNAFSKIVILKPGWNDLTLDFATDLNKPDRFVEFQVQEWGNPRIPIIYIDDIGLL